MLLLLYLLRFAVASNSQPFSSLSLFLSLLFYFLSGHNIFYITGLVEH